MGIAALSALSEITCGFFFTWLSPPGSVCVTLAVAGEGMGDEASPVSLSSGSEGRSYM